MARNDDSTRTAELRKGTTDLFILTLAASEPVYGQGLLDDERTGAFMRAGSVYPALGRLEKSGDLASEWIEPDGGRKRRMYVITDQGRHTLGVLTTEWDQLDSSLRPMWAANSA